MNEEINSILDIKDSYEEVKRLGNKRATSADDVGEYVYKRKQFINQSIAFLENEVGFRIKHLEDKVIVHDIFGIEFFTAKIKNYLHINEENWKIKFIEKCIEFFLG